jgi:hypothetical protein
VNSFLLRKYISESLQEISRSSLGSKLRIFDFDDTLVKTGSLIHVISPSGEKFDLTPGEYAVYEKKPGEEYDYSDFSRLVDPKAIIWTNNILKKIIDKGGEVVILTARGTEIPVHQFLSDAGFPPLEVIALGDSNPLMKSGWIEKKLKRGGISLVEFFDDSYKNIAAVEALKPKYPHVKIIARHIVHKNNEG